MALDLGGTNFRVLAITLNGLKVEMKNKIYPIAPEIMTGKATQVCVCACMCVLKLINYLLVHLKPVQLNEVFR